MKRTINKSPPLTLFHSFIRYAHSVHPVHSGRDSGTVRHDYHIYDWHIRTTVHGTKVRTKYYVQTLIFQLELSSCRRHVLSRVPFPRVSAVFRHPHVSMQVFSFSSWPFWQRLASFWNSDCPCSVCTNHTTLRSALGRSRRHFSVGRFPYIPSAVCTTSH